MTAQQTIDYPALYDAADTRSAKAQKWYFRLIIAEYAVMALAAIMAWMDGVHFITIPPSAFAIAFMALAGIATIAHFWNPDKTWYGARAMAESIKTNSWRYMMRAEPFGGPADHPPARAAFKDTLKQIFESSKSIITQSDDTVPKQDQITASMEAFRALSLEERFDTYRRLRIGDQLSWYARKARFNMSWSRRWYAAICVIYIVPILLIFVGEMNVRDHWPMFSLFLLLGSGLFGWAKAKRHKELAATYKLSEYEISLMDTETGSITTEDAFSDFINSAELAFSREHTQWVARQT